MDVQDAVERPDRHRQVYAFQGSSTPPIHDCVMSRLSTAVVLAVSRCTSRGQMQTVQKRPGGSPPYVPSTRAQLCQSTTAIAACPDQEMAHGRRRGVPSLGLNDCSAASGKTVENLKFAISHPAGHEPLIDIAFGAWAKSESEHLLLTY